MISSYDLDLEKSHGVVLHFLNKEKIIECINQLKNTPAGLDSQLAKTIRYGIAFHHAGRLKLLKFLGKDTFWQNCNFFV